MPARDVSFSGVGRLRQRSVIYRQLKKEKAALRQMPVADLVIYRNEMRSQSHQSIVNKYDRPPFKSTAYVVRRCRSQPAGLSNDR